jgi:hypothetical protein
MHICTRSGTAEVIGDIGNRIAQGEDARELPIGVLPVYDTELPVASFENSPEFRDATSSNLEQPAP